MVASCPEPSPLLDDTMGGLLAKVVEQGNTYRECRAAALAGQPLDATSYSLGGKIKP